jgi:hypothetical protein
MKKSLLLLSFYVLCSTAYKAQVDSLSTDTVPEEDFSMYDNFDFAEQGAKRFCTPKVFDLSPAKLITIGYDHQTGFDLDHSSLNDGPSTNFPAGTTNFIGAGGLRLGANIPVISKTNVVWQMGFNYWRIGYSSNDPVLVSPLSNTLLTNGLTTAGLQTTVFKPLNDKRFFLAQASADLNGDYDLTNILPLKYTRYSAAVLYGVKTNDRKMIAFGVSRTYRVGEINYIPVMLLNWTAPSRKWGVEMLAPARAQIRKNITPRHLLFVGYELEGQSYRLFNPGNGLLKGYELRRSELRFRVMYEQSLYKFIWLSVQAGYRYDYSFNVDQFENDKEFFRGFFGDQPYAMENQLTGSFYTFISLNLVSP